VGVPYLKGNMLRPYTGVARNFVWKGSKMEKYCDVSLVAFFGDI